MLRGIKVTKSFLLGKTFCEFQKELIRRHIKVRRDEYCLENEDSCSYKNCCVIRQKRLQGEDYYKLSCQKCCNFNQSEHGINWAIRYGKATREAWEALEKIGADEVLFDFEKYEIPTTIITKQQKQLFCLRCDCVKDASFIRKDTENFCCNRPERKI